jgi:hypothetical protein
MRKDLSKWSFDVFTGQIKIEGGTQQHTLLKQLQAKFQAQ